MRSENLAGLEATYRSLVDSLAGGPLGTEACFGTGGADPKVVFVLGLPHGLHPLDEEGQGKFEQLCKAMQLQPDEVYITTIIKTLTLATRPPHPADTRRDRPWITRQLELLAPQMIVAFGSKVGAILTQDGVELNPPGAVSSCALGSAAASTPVHITHEFSVLTQRGRDDQRAKEMWSHLQEVMKAVGL